MHGRGFSTKDADHAAFEHVHRAIVMLLRGMGRAIRIPGLRYASPPAIHIAPLARQTPGVQKMLE
jgi:hypothetical protein